LCIDNVYQLLEEERVTSPENMQRNKLYHMTDAYVRLVTLLIKNSGEAGNTNPKINLLTKVRMIMMSYLNSIYDLFNISDSDDYGGMFIARPQRTRNRIPTIAIFPNFGYVVLRFERIRASFGSDQLPGILFFIRLHLLFYLTLFSYSF
jgi:hypothetical protein